MLDLWFLYWQRNLVLDSYYWTHRKSINLYPPSMNIKNHAKSGTPFVEGLRWYIDLVCPFPKLPYWSLEYDLPKYSSVTLLLFNFPHIHSIIHLYISISVIQKNKNKLRLSHKKNLSYRHGTIFSIIYQASLKKIISKKSSLGRNLWWCLTHFPFMVNHYHE